MSNTNTPSGLSPVMTSTGAAWNQQATLYVIPSTDGSQYGLGDVVFSKAGSDANGTPYVQKATATSIPRGVIVGIDPVLNSGLSLQGTPLSLETIAIPATKTRDYYIYVVDDPTVIFKARCDNTATLVASATIGLNAKIVVGNPASGSAFSSTVIDHTNIATTSTFMLKILGLVRQPNNDFTAYSEFLVRFNTHEFFGSTTGAS